MLAIAIITIVWCNTPTVLELYWPPPKLFLISFCAGVCSVLIARTAEIVVFLRLKHDVIANRACEPDEPYNETVVRLENQRKAS